MNLGTMACCSYTDHSVLASLPLPLAGDGILQRTGLWFAFALIMDTAGQLESVLRTSHELFQLQHAHLPPHHVERLWQQEWHRLGSTVNFSTRPQKRPTSTFGGQEPPTKRSGSVGLLTASPALLV